LKLIKTVPEIEQYTKDEGAERETDYVFSEEAYFDWIGNAPETLALRLDPGPTLRHLSWRDAPLDEGLRTSLFKADRWAPLRVAGDQTGSEAAGTQANLGD
jgi:hypothetical protein